MQATIDGVCAEALDCKCIMRKRDMEIEQLKQEFIITHHARERSKERGIWTVHIGDVFDSILSMRIYQDTEYLGRYRVLWKYADYVIDENLSIITTFRHDEKLWQWVLERFHTVSKSKIKKMLGIKIKPNIKQIYYRPIQWSFTP